jgi:hypothetical protein
MQESRKRCESNTCTSARAVLSEGSTSAVALKREPRSVEQLHLTTLRSHKSWSPPSMSVGQCEVWKLPLTSGRSWPGPTAYGPRVSGDSFDRQVYGAEIDVAYSCLRPIAAVRLCELEARQLPLDPIAGTAGRQATPRRRNSTSPHGAATPLPIGSLLPTERRRRSPEDGWRDNSAGCGGAL